MSMLSKSVLLRTCLLALGLLAFSGCGNRTNRASTPAANGNDSADADAEKQSNDQPPVPPKKGPPTLVDLSREAEERIRTAMQTKIDITLEDMALQEFVQLVAEKGNFPVWINEIALSEEGIAPDEPLTDELHDVTIEHALDWTLEPLGLTWLIEDEILKVTTEVDAEEHLTTRTYDVSALLAVERQHEKKQAAVTRHFQKFSQLALRSYTGNRPEINQQNRPTEESLISVQTHGTSRPATELMQFGGPMGTGGFGPTYWPQPNEGDWLTELILFVTSGPWMESDGTGGTMDIMNDVLIVRQTAKVQQEVDRLLVVLNTVAQGNSSGRSIVSRPANYPFDADQQIHAALKKNTSVEYLDDPLSSVVADLAERHKIRIRLETTPLAEEGIANDEPITLTMNGVLLDFILQVMLEPLGLTYFISEGALRITTEIDAEEILHTTVYDVRDLVGPDGDYDSLIEVIQQETSGPWMETDGTGGTMSEATPLGALAIRQTYKVHREVAQLFADMRATMAAQPKIDRPKRNVDAVVTRVYNLAGMKLVDDLLTAVPKFVAADTWGDKNKSHSIQKVGESLVIRQSVKVHEKIDKFLQQFGYYHNEGGVFGFGARSGNGNGADKGTGSGTGYF